MNIFQDYYEAKLALDILTKEVEEKKSELIKTLLSVPDNKVEMTGVKFYLKKEFIYEFSAKAHFLEKRSEEIIEGIKEKLKGLQTGVRKIKVQEIENGTAKLIDTKYIPVMMIKKGGE